MIINYFSWNYGPNLIKLNITPFQLNFIETFFELSKI